MPACKIHKVYFQPGSDVVSVAVEFADGPMVGRLLVDLYTTQQALSDLTMITREIEEPDENWGDAELELEIGAQLGEMGYDLVSTVPPPEEEEEPEEEPEA